MLKVSSVGSCEPCCGGGVDAVDSGFWVDVNEAEEGRTSFVGVVCSTVMLMEYIDDCVEGLWDDVGQNEDFFVVDRSDANA